MEGLREQLHEAIDIYGLDYERVIEVDKKLHDEIVKEMRLCLKK